MSRIALFFLFLIVIATTVSLRRAVAVQPVKKLVRLHQDHKQWLRQHGFRSMLDVWCAPEARRRAWHGPYHHPQAGRPIPLVVPPTAGMHTEYSWGVTMNEMRPIYHQYSRGVSGRTTERGVHTRPPAYRPASTRHSGVYYLRVPW